MSVTAPPDLIEARSFIAIYKSQTLFRPVTTAMAHSHDHGEVSHSHAGGDHGHTHEILDGPGSYLGREMPIVEGRDWRERAFTIGIGGYAQHSE
jgi:hypothetical protein